MVVASFNRVAVSDLGLPAAAVALLIGVYTLFGPIQPVIGRMAERWPLFRYRRTPYMLLGTLLGSLAFPFMPGVLLAMQAGENWAYLQCLALFVAFGVCIAMQANVFLDLLNDVTTPETRSRVVTVTWTVQALAMAGWAWVFALLMPEYSHEAMQRMYNLSPIIMVGIAVLGLWGLETRMTEEEVAEIKRNPPPPVKLLEPIKESMNVVGYNRHAALFFVFIIFSLLSVFLQDMLQEIWAGDLFGMAAGESTIFQRLYNGLQTVGMAACGIFVGVTAKKRMAASADPDNEKTLPMDFGKKLLLIGALLSILGFLLLAWAAYVKDLNLFYAFYCFSAFSLGLYVFPSISFMADMTVSGQESKYLGLWSLAQVIGLFLSFTVSGALYSLLVESQWLPANEAFSLIFLLQALMVVLCFLAVRNVTVEGLQAGARDN